MDVFTIHERLIDDYRSFTSGSVVLRDQRIREHFERQLEEGRRSPEPWLSLNPSFDCGGSISELVALGLLDPECERIFRPKTRTEDPGASALNLHRHQREAVEVARAAIRTS